VTAHPSSLQLDAMAAGHLGDADAAAVRAHVGGCTRCRGDLEAAEAACAEFARDVLPRTIGRLRPRPSRWRLLVPALAVPVLAAAALVLWLRRPDAVPDDNLRMKGGLSFQVFAERAGDVIAVGDGTRLAPGDRIRFVVGSGGPSYLLVASIDGAGTATVYYPYGGEHSGSAAVQPAELPGSIVLDAAPGPERVFALRPSSARSAWSARAVQLRSATRARSMSKQRRRHRWYSRR
jgi:hypothetical protein